MNNDLLQNAARAINMRRYRYTDENGNQLDRRMTFFKNELCDIKFLKEDNINLPKTPISCNRCKSNGNVGKMIPISFCINGAREIFLKFRCNRCRHITYMRLHHYLVEYVGFNDLNGKYHKPRSARSDKEIIQEKVSRKENYEECLKENFKKFLNVSDEEAERLVKEEKERSAKFEKERRREMDELHAEREAEKLKEISNKRKTLIQSGKVAYDKKNHVFYYTETGKVYEG